jgi:uncharacterized protein YndB with AHSA1/START domain
MQRAEATASIPAPIGELFAFLADPSNLPAWQTGILSAELTSQPPVGVGSKARVVRQLMGQRIVADLVMTAFEPDHRLVLESTVSGIAAVAELELAPGEEATELRFAMSFSATNVFMAPFEGMAAGAAQGDLASSLERLRTHFSG